MPVVPFIPLIAAGLTVGAGAVMSNQATQHAKGAAQAQETAMNGQVEKANALDTADKNAKATNAGSTQAAAIAAIRASMTTKNSAGGTILTGPLGAPPAPTATKTLLGT